MGVRHEARYIAVVDEFDTVEGLRRGMLAFGPYEEAEREDRERLILS